MPRRVQLGRKDRQWDNRTISVMSAPNSGSALARPGSHLLLGPAHDDTETERPMRGAIILGDSTVEWGILEHPYAAGRILLTDATDMSWAAANASVPVAPGARGHIIRAEAGPVWNSYAAATDGAVLIGDGTDIISDTTPTYTGAPTWNAGPLTLADAVDIVTGTTTGTEIGTAANQKIGFWGTTPIVQLPKASYNNWAAFTDVVNALVAVGLFDAA